MADYYSYLWSISWPSVVLGLLLFFFIAGRMGWKVWQAIKSRRTFLSLSWLSWRFLIWIGILIIYGAALFSRYPDWYYKPFYFTGTIVEKYIDQENNSSLQINQENGQIKVTIDQSSYGQLLVGDYVQIMYLPVRGEVVTCQVIRLPKETENSELNN